jgi:hypothetical protein
LRCWWRLVPVRRALTKVTEFNKTKAEDGTVQLDSTKYYRDVVITFRGKDYDKYTVTFYADEQ